MKKLILLLFLVTIIPSALIAGVYNTHNEPDSAYIFTYATNKANNHNGLHIAWSIDGKNWHAIGPEYSFLKSDFGRWGSQKRMFSPVVIQDKDGLWHCLFTVNEEVGVIAHTSSKDMLTWRPQSYNYPTDGNRTEIEMSYKRKISERNLVTISGEEQEGIITRVSWKVIDTLIKGVQLAEYKNRLFGENSSQDITRFANLKPVEATLTIHPEQSKFISDMLIGIFFEDINYAADGGIYAELIQNRDFEYSPADKEGHDKTWNSKKAWTLKGSTTPLAIDTVAPIHPNNKHYAVLNGPSVQLVNEGWEGIPLKKGEKYIFSMFSRVDGKGGKFLVTLKDKDGKVYGEGALNISGNDWKKREIVITAKETTDHASLELAPVFAGTVYLDMISLFPQNTFKGRKNGLRADLAQTLADMNPRFVRFPGGCVAHGDGLGNMYRWKNTIGPLESRVPQRNLWGYHQTAGLGYYEYFQFCEDIGAEPLPVLPAGVPCQNSGTGGHGQQCGIPMEHMDEYIQEVLDLIEWANGDAKKTVWGKKRAEAGHPKPFNLKYLGIGNEDLISDVFEERYAMICNAVRQKYPDIIVIGTVGPFWEGSDYEEGWRIATDLKLPMVDEHYYNSPGWYIHNQDFYDRYDRNKSKVYLGEYAAHLPGRPNNIETALAEALHLANVERNGDVVSLTSYAPLLAKEGHTQWNPDLIYFNNTEVKPTVGYYVQQLYGQNAGNEYLSSSLELSERRGDVQKRVVSSVVYDSQTGNYIIKLVNMLPVPVNTTIDLSPLHLLTDNAVLTVLSGRPDDKTAKPVTSDITVGEELKQELPAYSFTVIRLKELKQELPYSFTKIRLKK
ncbi:alpha-L-arabinofuranosidase C-terminal domain-containing protein [Bacteroides sp. 519]|uniref:alpha-L-arabinofuranosidase C-terminal domain-containing protein n=1 Tax=Bacteroides sp. 519 TaxID=2302937 RepID=UPI0013D1FD8B|nr:alpha-L-arabinofuranosidase C-terminal domain-containing protein [Bacteroides sp. 519]NDV60431.1 alpha-L-arabinofuranosidase [Bacteroides sp. 519]